MVIIFAILAFILFAGMIGDKEQKNRDNYTKAFIAVIIGITALYMVAWG